MEAQAKDALLEIGAEEIPSSYLPPALEFLKTRAEARLAERGLPYKSAHVYGTPRRLTLLLCGLAQKSNVRVEEALGPKVAASKDAEGHWTAAAQGFAKSQGVSLNQLEVRNTAKGEVLCAVKKHEGIRAEKILTEFFSGLPAEIPFPKKMIWEKSGFRFARPIRNVLALFGSQALHFSVAGVKAGNKTFTLSRISSKLTAIASPQSYLGTLKNHCIIADPAARKDLIRSSAAQLARKVKGTVKADEDLLEEICWLVEHPVGILGNFNPEFLSLPSEVLMTCMKKYQKFFSVTDASGNLLPHFVGVRNGISEHQETVRSGYEKVLLARLFDAKFFFEEDLKKSAERFAQRSAAITVQERLGSVGEKIVRMKALGEAVARGLAVQLDRPAIERAIHLCKFDLSTRMVYEMPELQGVMGEIYALRFGESPKTARAIREHYYPLGSQGPVPQAGEAKVVALSEKLDQLCGNFWLGFAPTGNTDPYGLRRHASGILRILLEAGWDIPLKDLVALAVSQIAPRDPKVNASKAEESARAFLLERLQLLMQDLGFELDEIYSVTKNAGDPDLESLKVISLRAKIDALHQVREHPDFEAVAGAYKRAGNILRQARQKGMEISRDSFDAALLKEPAEKNLHVTVDELIRKTQPLLDGRQYQAALQNWVQVRPELDQFFEKVLVMDQDEKVCRNRLSLLSILESRFRQLADFSRIQNRAGTDGGKESLT